MNEAITKRNVALSEGATVNIQSLVPQQQIDKMRIEYNITLQSNKGVYEIDTYDILPISRSSTPTSSHQWLSSGIAI